MAAEPDGRATGSLDRAVAGLNQEHPVPVRHTPPAVYIVLTLVTIVWLLVQVAAGIRQTDQPYPVTGFAMFSHPSSGVQVEFALEGTTASGEQVTLEPGDFGLTRLQLRSFVAFQIGPSPDALQPDARQRVADLAEEWSQRQGDELGELTLTRVEIPTDGGERRELPMEQWP